jgi:hypothetical protein
MAYLAILLSLFLPPAVTSVQLQGTEGKPADIYERIPKDQRELLRQAVNKLIEAQKMGDWKNVYKLLDKESKQDEDTFLRKMKRAHLLRDYQPSRVIFYPPNDEWIIEGCASFQTDAKQKGHVAWVIARWTDSRWYLSPISIEMFGNEKKANPRECATD